mgnify:CR=1 FL=1
MEYILRVAVHEDAWQRQLGELLELCARTPIREVMLMEESHQILTSPFPRTKHERMAAVYARMAEAFAAAGVRYSVNLVTCAGHGDNRVPARLALPFQRFVGEDLAPAHAVYCIADEAWVEYTAQISALSQAGGASVQSFSFSDASGTATGTEGTPDTGNDEIASIISSYLAI